MPAFTKECKLCSHFNSLKCKQCLAQLAIGGNPTAKKGKKCKVCGNITVGHVNTPHCWLLLKKKLLSKNTAVTLQWRIYNLIKGFKSKIRMRAHGIPGGALPTL